MKRDRIAKLIMFSCIMIIVGGIKYYQTMDNDPNETSLWHRKDDIIVFLL